MKALVVIVTFKKKKALVVGAYSGHSDVSRSPIDSSRGEESPWQISGTITKLNQDICIQTRDSAAARVILSKLFMQSSAQPIS